MEYVLGGFAGFCMGALLIHYTTVRSLTNKILSMQYRGFAVMGDIEQPIPKTSPMWPENYEDV